MPLGNQGGPEPRDGAYAVRSGRDVYVAGGATLSGIVARYDPTVGVST